MTFIGTDIFKGDYGSNENITLGLLPKMLQLLKEKADAANAT